MCVKYSRTSLSPCSGADSKSDAEISVRFESADACDCVSLSVSRVSRPLTQGGFFTTCCDRGGINQKHAGVTAIMTERRAGHLDLDEEVQIHKSSVQPGASAAAAAAASRPMLSAVASRFR